MIVNVSVCALSFAGPALIAVAHGLIVCAPMSLITVWFGPTAKLGTSLIGFSVIATVAGAELVRPSFATKLKLSAPNSFAFGV